MKLITIFIILILFCCVIPFFALAELSLGFYSSSCPRAEAIVREVVQRHFNKDRSIAGALLRMHFHDCFVRGCDASILIDSTSTKGSEKNAGPNQTVRGFELIDEAKSLLEQACPSTVSCADIITLATRDAVALSNGPIYNIPTGRRDGLLSDPSIVNLPGPFFTVSRALQSFISKGLTIEEMVTLLGAHTVGFAHCSAFQERLSSFQAGNLDPTMDPALDATLVRTCGSFARPARDDPVVFLDQQSPSEFDNQFYNQILARRGVLRIDQELAMDPVSAELVSKFAADNERFRVSFANAMVKMASIDVLVGNEGEIRKNCRAFNFPL